ncbi:MAG: PAS domain S-box protein [Candidatus Marinimicrobia bacterium]|nr:PAS domain S-box protein [Candidatus Neomarinimicrobiota bacterium]
MLKPADIIRILIDFDQQISRPDYEKVIRNALLFFYSTFKFDSISLSLANNANTDSDVFTFEGSHSVTLADQEKLLNKTSLKQTISQKSPRYRKALAQQKRLNSFENALKSRGIQSYLLVPLLIGETVVGSLNVGSKNVSGISKEVRSTIALLSQRLSFALHHARLHDSLKKKEHLLASSEERYQTLFTNSPDPVVVHDGTVILDANQAALRFFNSKTNEKYIGKPISDFIHPDSLVQSKNRIKQLLTSKQANRPTLQQFLTADGAVRDVEANAAVIDYKGQTAIVTSFRDITEQKRDQDLLRASEENFRNLFEANPNPIIVHQDGVIVYVNQAALVFAGKGTLSDYIGQDIFSFVHEDSREKALENALLIQNDGLATIAGEQKYLRANGEVRNVDSRGVPIMYMDKPSVMVSFIDTTDRVDARQALLENQQQLELITDHVTHFIVLMDLDFNLLYVNRACVDWFGIKRTALLNGNMADLIVPDAVTASLAQMDAVKQGHKADFFYTFESKKGRLFEFFIVFIPVFDQDKNVFAVLAQVEDITERELSRKALAENKRLLELIIDTIPGLFAYADVDENYLYANQAYADWNQQPKSAIVGNSMKQILPLKTYRFIKPRLAKIKSGEPQAYSRDTKALTGRNCSLDIQYIPHLDHQKKVIGFLTSIQDVTEKKQVESYQIAQRELAYNLTNTLDVHRVGKISAEIIRGVFKSDAFSLDLYNYADEIVHGIYSEDTFVDKSKPQEVKSYNIPFSDLSSDWFSPDFTAFCTNRTPAEINRGIETIPFGDNRLSHSLLFVPIRWEGKNIGLVSVQSYTQNTYSDADLPLLQSFSDQIGGALVRAQREEQLEEQRKLLVREEKKYRALIENAGDAVFVATLGGNIHIVNEQFCSALGYTQEELLDLNIRDIDPQFFRTLNREKIASLKGEKNSYTLESNYRTKTNLSFPVEQRISLCEIARKPNILCFSRNITQRKLTELRELSLRKLAHDLNDSTSMHTVGQLAARAIRSFFDSDAFAVEFFDTENQMILGVYSEDTFRTEKTPREVSVGDTAFSEVRSDFFKLNAIVHVRNRSAQQLKKLRNNRPFGSGRLSHSLLFAPIVWENNNIGILTVQSYTDNKYSNSDLGDIQTFADQIGGALMRTRKDEELTAKKNELQESEEKYRSIIENAGDALFVSSLRGDILAFNQRAAESLGYSEKQLFSLNLKEFDPDFRKQLSVKRLNKLAEDQSSITIETNHIRQDGSRFPVELRVGTMVMGGKQAVLYFARDISERKANEIFREALRKMTRALTVPLQPWEVGQIAATVLYDLFSQDAFALYQIDIPNHLARNLYAEDTFLGDDRPQEIAIDSSLFDFHKNAEVMSIPRPLLINRKKGCKTVSLDVFGDVSRKSKSLVFVPLFWEGDQIGVFSLQSYTANKFTEDDIEKLKIFANQIGGALVRAKTDAELLNQTEELTIREQDLKALVNEKDVLLKEVYHRTKNNMQVIVGLLEMHSYKTTQKATLAVIEEMVNRIASMGMVHDLLYRSKRLDVIQLDDYLEKLINRLLTAYQTSTGEIVLNFESEAIPVDIQFAVPLGLVINEVVSNTLKYAFPDNCDGQITVSIKTWKDRGLDLKIGDNGIGLKKGFNPGRSTSLGMRIIQDIIRLQLFGDITTISANGLMYHIKIPSLVLE